MGYQIIFKNNQHEIIEKLKNQQLVILPTDTVWGILSANEKALYDIKQRDKNKKIVKFVKQDFLNGKLDTKQLAIVNNFWPGALTVVFNKVAYRCPNDKLLLSIINEFNEPLYCSSANLSNHPVITTIQEAIDVFKNYTANYFIYETINYENKKVSTILDLNSYEILRNGAIDQELLSFLKEHDILSK